MNKKNENLSELVTTLLAFLFVTPIVPFIIVIFKKDPDVIPLLGIYTFITLCIHIPLIRNEGYSVIQKLKSLMLSMVFAAPITSILCLIIFRIDYREVNWSGLLYSLISIAAIIVVVLLIFEWLNKRSRK